MKITRFEELDCWKAARELVKMAYEVAGKGPLAKDFGLRDQIQRAAVSTMANIAEGFSTRSEIEFIRFLDFSIRSAIEVQSHLYVLLDLGYISEEEFGKIFSKAQDCVNLDKGFIRYLKEKS